MMKYLWLLASLLLAGCTPSEKPQRENPLQGAWVLSKVEFPMGGIEKKLVTYIVNCCKTKNAPEDIQQMIKQNMFK